MNLKFTRAPSAITHALLALCCTLSGAFAQITVTSDPADGATGVSRSGPVVFTFSAPVNPTASSVLFSSPSSQFILVPTSWSAGNTVLTCTPSTPFDANTEISWNLFALDTGMNLVTASGSFTTGTTGGGAGGTGTNAITTFSVARFNLFEQFTAGAPTPFPEGPYDFSATTGIASNRVATAVSVTIPGTSTPVSLTQNFVQHEDYYLVDFSTNQAALDASYPPGAYAFSVTGPSNLSASVTLPPVSAQPPAPHLSNFAAAQAIDATKAFTLTWDAFQGGTASDFISVQITDSSHNPVYKSPDPGTNGALTGVATSFTIPAGKLVAGTSNTAEIVFYHFVAATNASYATIAARSTGTDVNLVTVGGGGTGPTPVVSNPVVLGGKLGIDVTTVANQVLKVRFSTDLSVPYAQWSTILTTNSPGTTVHLSLPAQVGANGFIRIENGP